MSNAQTLAFAYKTSIRQAIVNKREVRITDSGDLLCFHAKDGKILYDGERRMKIRIDSLNITIITSPDRSPRSFIELSKLCEEFKQKIQNLGFKYISESKS